MSVARLTSVMAPSEFLKAARKFFLGFGEHNFTVNIVMGNEASDLDSVASSIAYAWFLTHRTEGKILYVPVLNIPRGDLELRAETPWLLARSGLDQSQLVYRDDFSFQELKDRGNFWVHLTDHNKLARSQEFLAPHVKSIIDHHKDESKELYPQCEDSEIKVCGCTCSLLVLRMHGVDPDLLSHRHCWGMTQLLTAAIVIDTFNMSPTYGKGTDTDRTALDILQGRDSLLAQIQHLRTDTSGLSTRQLLRKDLKLGRDGGINHAIASVSLRFAKWVVKDPNLVNEFAGYLKDGQYDVMIVMTIYSGSDGKICRELAIVTLNNNELQQKLLSALAQQTELFGVSELDLSGLASPQSGVQCTFYSQSNSRSSRKVLRPWLVDLLGP